jgi:hypothetical protein
MVFKLLFWQFLKVMSLAEAERVYQHYFKILVLFYLSVQSHL